MENVHSEVYSSLIETLIDDEEKNITFLMQLEKLNVLILKLFGPKNIIIKV